MNQRSTSPFLLGTLSSNNSEWSGKMTAGNEHKEDEGLYSSALRYRRGGQMCFCGVSIVCVGLNVWVCLYSWVGGVRSRLGNRNFRSLTSTLQNLLQVFLQHSFLCVDKGWSLIHGEMKQGKERHVRGIWIGGEVIWQNKVFCSEENYAEWNDRKGWGRFSQSQEVFSL